MKLYKVNGPDGIDIWECDNVYDAVNLLGKDTVEELLLIYYYTYIAFNDCISDAKRIGMKEVFNKRIGRILDFYYKEKKFAPIEYVDRIAYIMNEIVPDEFKEEVIAICVGLFKSYGYRNWTKAYEMFGQLGYMNSFVDKEVAKKLNDKDNYKAFLKAIDKND